jgi:hypothetical protein
MINEAAVRSCLTEAGFTPDVFLNLVNMNPAASLPYHDNTHNYVVAVNAYQMGKELQMSTYQVNHMLVAGLFHDFDHTGGTLFDVTNIIRALKAVEDNREIFIRAGLQPWYVKQLIQATQNPPRTHYTIPEQVMRDADLMGWAEPGTRKLMTGLTAELGTPVTKETTKAFLREESRYMTEPARRKLVLAKWL